MVRLGKLKEKTLASKVTFAGETLNFEYKPGALRSQYYDVIQEGLAERDLDAVVRALLLTLVSWDLEVGVEELVEAGYYDETDENGQPKRTVPEQEYIVVPLELEAMKAADIPMPLFGMINDEIREDSVSGKGTKKGR